MARALAEIQMMLPSLRYASASNSPDDPSLLELVLKFPEPLGPDEIPPVRGGVLHDQLFGGGIAQDAGAGGVGDDEAPVQGALKNSFDRVFKDAAVLFFGPPQENLGPFLLGDVAHHSGETGRLVAVHQPPGGNPDVADASFLVQDAKLLRAHLPVQHPLQVLGKGGQVFEIDVPAQGMADHLLGAVQNDLLDHRADIGDASLGVQGKDDVVDVFDQVAVLLLRALQLLGRPLPFEGVRKNVAGHAQQADRLLRPGLAGLQGLETQKTDGNFSGEHGDQNERLRAVGLENSLLEPV